ncbi:MAG: histidinol-phosphate aminotransferase family protein [Gemmatimonadaceae bacterium]|nr:histidinol-phosphate aminotransferase family protein [Gemmatimonadaceae bacterium]
MIRPSIDALTRYAPPSGACPTDLADNTNRWGAPPAAGAKLRALADSMSAYPTLYGSHFADALAERFAVPRDQVVTGCGSDDILRAAILAGASAGDAIAYTAPTFVMVPVFAAMAGVRAIPLAPLPDGSADPAALLGSGARILYVCAPNNPTGAWTDPSVVRTLLAESDALVIVDEAYIDFADDPGLLADAVTSDRLIVARTMSKAWGLAGLRAGWAVASATWATAIEKARGPYTLNAVADVVAATAIREDAEWVAARAADAIAGREWLAAELRTRGLAPLPSRASFLCVPLADAPRIAAAMRTRGVAVRAFTALPGIGDALRISVGPSNELRDCLAALDASR